MRLSEAERIANVSAEIPQKPAASPSMPSMKLTMLAIATIHSTVSGYCAQPRLWTPITGRVMWSMVMPSQAGMAAIRIIPANLTAGRSGWMSSNAPSPAISAAPAMIPQKPCALPSASAGIAIAAKIARPPSSGVGLACRRRASVERSTAPIRQASSLATGVSSTASMNATAKPTTAA